LLEHGGNLAYAAEHYGIALAEWLDLSTGINPHPYPLPFIPSSAWHKLPQDNDGLLDAACAYYGCKAALACAGSQAVLQILPQVRCQLQLGAQAKVAMPALMYQEHARAWQSHGHEVLKFDAMPDASLLQQVDVLLLCNPNNPTAHQYSPEQLLHWHAEVAARGGWLVVDEAFIDSTPELSVAPYSHLPGLLVLRSLLAEKTLLNLAQERLGPWSVTGPSRVVATMALKDTEWQNATRSNLMRNSQNLAELLTHYGLTPIAATSLFQFVGTAEARLWQHHLAQRGIWVRLFQEQAALRFGLVPEPAWSRLEQALKAITIYGRLKKTRLKK
jgi:cobalamin biosynthesis protein CobC